MKNAAGVPTNPPKLVELEHPYARILAQGNRDYATRADETERFCRTHALSPRPRRGAWVLAPVALAAAALVALAIGVIPRSPRVSSVPKADEAPPVATEAPRAEHRPVTEPAAPPVVVELAAGARRLRDGSVVSVLPGSSARLKDREDRTSIELDTGKVTLAVESRPASSELEVSAGAYRFVVLGTRFSVTRAGDIVSLRVDEGRVAVFGDEGRLATVSAGGDWSSPAPANTPESPPLPRTQPPATATPPSDEREPGPDCRELARTGEPRKAEACYLARSAGAGLDAETALLEVARLRRDVLDDAAGALEALESYRKRFPSGSLRREADVAKVVLLTRLGRHHEALAESQRLLDSPGGKERAFELRMLRGSIYRKGMSDAARAAEEYALAEALGGAGSEATYLLGSCLEEIGDASGAAKAYRRYLEKAPKGKRASDIRQRLERMTP